MAKYLVTGGAGFIGSKKRANPVIVEELIERKQPPPDLPRPLLRGRETREVREDARNDISVRVLDNLSTGRRENIEPFIVERAACPLEFIEGDIRDRGSVRKAVDGVDYVLHQGALPSVPRSIDDPITTNEVNVNGTLNVLIAARDAGVKRVVYASSSPEIF